MNKIYASIWFKILFFNVDVSAKDINQVRRRLSVMSDNKLVEGIDNVTLETGEADKIEVTREQTKEHKTVLMT